MTPGSPEWRRLTASSIGICAKCGNPHKEQKCGYCRDLVKKRERRAAKQ